MQDIALGERIASWREHRGLTQVALAERLELTAGAIANWEVNTAVPTGKHLHELVDVLGLTMQQFWGRVPARKKKRARRRAA